MFSWVTIEGGPPYHSPFKIKALKQTPTAVASITQLILFYFTIFEWVLLEK